MLIHVHRHVKLCKRVLKWKSGWKEWEKEKRKAKKKEKKEKRKIEIKDVCKRKEMKGQSQIKWKREPWMRHKWPR